MIMILFIIIKNSMLGGRGPEKEFIKERGFNENFKLNVYKKVVKMNWKIRLIRFRKIG